MNLYNSNLETFLINTLKYCYDDDDKKICAFADTIENIQNEYLTISFKKFENLILKMIKTKRYFESDK